MNNQNIEQILGQVRDLVMKQDLRGALTVLEGAGPELAAIPEAKNLLTQLNSLKLSSKPTSSEEPVSNYLRQSLSQNVITVYAKLIKGFIRRDKLRCATVGSGSNITGIGELLYELSSIEMSHFGVDSAGVNPHFKGGLENFRPEEFDCVLIAGSSSSEDEAYLSKLKDVFKQNECSLPVLVLNQVIFQFWSALWELDELRSVLNIRKLAAISLALSLSPKEGRICECGSYRCGTSALAGKLLNAWGDPRTFDAIDTFEGMPEAHSKDGNTTFVAGTFAGTSFDEAVNYIERNGVSPKVSVHKGLVQEVLPRILNQEDTISFGFADTDQYLGTAESLKCMIPLLGENGIIIVDDYSLEGVERAVAEVSRQHPSVEGFELITNFYILWDKNKRNGAFLSNC